MNVEIISKNAEPLLKRHSFEAKIVFEGKTPSRLDMMKDVCNKLQSNDKLTIIRKITTDYGSERASVKGYFYDDEASFNKLENRYSKTRHLTKEAQNAEKEKIKAEKQAKKAAKK